MVSMLSNMIKNNTDISDEVIASNMLASGSLNQIVGGHSALTELAVKRGWEKAYSSPTQQLSEAYNKSKMMVETKEE